MLLPQTIIGAATVCTGVLSYAMGRRKREWNDLRTPLVSARGKLVLGYALIFVGSMIFLSQFVGPRPDGMPRPRGMSQLQRAGSPS